MNKTHADWASEHGTLAEAAATIHAQQLEIARLEMEVEQLTGEMRMETTTELQREYEDHKKHWNYFGHPHLTFDEFVKWFTEFKKWGAIYDAELKPHYNERLFPFPAELREREREIWRHLYECESALGY